MSHQRNLLISWLRPVLATLVVAVALVFLGRLLDFGLLSDRADLVWTGWFVVADPETARTIILAILEVLAGMFAISITVVAIIVQLAATRYTPRVVDLFLADPFNRAVLFAYVVPLVFGFWLADSITEQAYSRSSMTLFIGLSTLSIVLVIPYFSFVFRFLQPANIIASIETACENSINRALRGPAEIARSRAEVAHSVQQLGDISQASLAHSDIALALDGLDSLKLIATYYVQRKPSLGETWFEVEDGQILGLSEDARADIIRDRVWLEMLVFKRYELVFTSALRRARDITSCVAMNLREIGVLAVAASDLRSVDFVIKGFNTLVMYALSERDIRSAVHVFYQYRLLAETLLDRPDVTARIGRHFKYYGQNSQKRGIFFIQDAVAYDLRVLIMACLDDHPDTMEALLEVFLELDRESRNTAGTQMLKGVRKSQAILGAFFIRADRDDLARRVASDMGAGSREILESVRSELRVSSSRDFWEIEDRGLSFYHVADDELPSLDQFFALLESD